jgi:hypothetical protein
MIFDGGDHLGREAGGMEQPPERVSLAGEVMAELPRARTRVDPDEQDLRVVGDDVGEPRQARRA